LNVKIKIDSLLKQRVGMSLVAFGLALLLWIFVVSKNEYTMVLDLPIEARNLSVQKAHKEEVPPFASVRLRGTGRDLFKSFLLKNFARFKLVLDLEGISQEYEFNLNEYFEKYPRKVVLPLNYNVSFVEVVYPNRIKISLDEYRLKKVPILSNILIIPAPGYMLVGNPKINPHELEIAGPKEELALINHVETVFDTISGIVFPYSGIVALESFGRLIKFSQEEININFEIQEISERIIADIPVVIENIPEKIRVFPSPQTVSLTIVGGIKRITAINPDEINVVIDFNRWNYQIQFYEPIVKIPSDILSWRDISPKNLEIAVAREIR